MERTHHEKLIGGLMRIPAACGLALLLFLAPDTFADPTVVASDGSAPFKTVQSAIDSIPADNTDPRVILIKPGTYKERIQIPKNKPFVTLKSDETDPSKTILTFDRHAGMDDPD